MTLGIGKDAWVGFGAQTVIDTPGTVDQWLRIISATPSISKSNFVSRGRRGTMPRQVYFGPDKVEMELVVELSYEGLELLLSNFFGTYTFTASTPVAGTSTHAFSIGDDTFPGLTMNVYLGIAANTLQLVGCHISKLRIEFAQDQPLTATFSISGVKDNSWVTAGSPTFPDDLPILPVQIGALLFGAAPRNVVDGFVEIERPRATDRVFIGNDYHQYAYHNGPTMVSTQLTVEFDDGAAGGNDIFEAFKDDTAPSQLLISASGDIITGATPYSWNLNVSEIKWIGDTPAVQDDDINRFTVTGMGTDSTEATGGGIAWTTINSLATKVS